MALQTAVNLDQAFGVVGEFRTDGPSRATPFTLDSASAANNVIGRAFTVKSEGVAQAGTAAATFAGILINPKSYVSAGTAANGTLAETIVLRNGEVAELATMGSIIVQAIGAPAIGTGVFYTDATGVLGFGTAAGGQTQIAGAIVWEYTPTNNSLVVIRIGN